MRDERERNVRVVKHFPTMLELLDKRWTHVTVVFRRDVYLSCELFVDGLSTGPEQVSPLNFSFAAGGRYIITTFELSESVRNMPGENAQNLNFSQLGMYPFGLTNSEIYLMCSVRPEYTPFSMYESVENENVPIIRHVHAHRSQGCDGCNEYPILGVSWSCVECDPAYDLCSKCMQKSVYEGVCVEGRDSDLHNIRHLYLPHWKPAPRFNSLRREAMIRSRIAAIPTNSVSTEQLASAEDPLQFLYFIHAI
eukprot:CAMPEP_0182450506 /NCGR_PEP_ID=MMETSP1172-20130603/41750_1 /TAXON_ID=708627 /ORGANISM="Timspurckia oligopyrenoides, Strain CCMP3278" /LENGTH=250 /DNA_ID=CAMNT_0024648129 /DNA_START=540 /DNA_END=1292 /DNA_ORIENTATION=+